MKQLIYKEDVLQEISSCDNEIFVTEAEQEYLWKRIQMLPTVEAIPVEFIESKLETMRKIADDEFERNGGYVNEFDYRMWALKGLLQDWEDYKEQEDEEK